MTTTELDIRVENGKVVRPEYTDPQDASKYTYLPKAKGPIKPHYTMLDGKCPKETLHILGISFHVYAHTPIERLTDQVEPVVPVFPLSENQAQSIIKKAETKILEWYEPKEVEPGKWIQVKKTAPASDFITVKRLPEGEYGKTVTWKKVMELRGEEKTEEMVEKDRQIAELQAKLDEALKNAKESEKKNKNKK